MNTSKLSMDAIKRMIVRNLKKEYNSVRLVSTNLMIALQLLINRHELAESAASHLRDSYNSILNGLNNPMNFYYVADFYLDLYSYAKQEDLTSSKEAADYAALFRILNDTADYDEAMTTVSRLYPSEPLVQALTNNTARWMPVRYEGVNKDSGYADEFCSWALIQDKRILAHDKKYYVYKSDYTNLKAKEIMKWN